MGANTNSRILAMLACFGRKRRRIALFGGLFDPVTDAHMMVVAEVIHCKLVDEVWIVPNHPEPPQTNSANLLDRWMMLHMAVNSTFGSRFPVKVLDFELKSSETTGTYALVQEMIAQYPSYHFCLIVGSNLLGRIRNWSSPGVPNAGELLYDTYDFIVANRPGYPLPDKMPPNFTVLGRQEDLHQSSWPCFPNGKSHPAPMNPVVTDMSASEIRHRLNIGYQHVEGLIPPVVLAHIIRNRLYVNSPESI
eukprot:c15965_g1_i1.p1 GENE.c15965_g1_i1~~c15965_g1_i1.p1  ORF type:complete len:249 (-),score=35.08 c15965_g1_i1:46-792(-)